MNNWVSAALAVGCWICWFRAHGVGLAAAETNQDSYWPTGQDTLSRSMWPNWPRWPGTGAVAGAGALRTVEIAN